MLTRIASLLPLLSQTVVKLANPKGIDVALEYFRLLSLDTNLFHVKCHSLKIKSSL